MPFTHPYLWCYHEPTSILGILRRHYQHIRTGNIVSDGFGRLISELSIPIFVLIALILRYLFQAAPQMLSWGLFSLFID